MLDVKINRQYQVIPGIGFMVLKVEVEPTYKTSKIEKNMEYAVTRAAKLTCGDSKSWKDIEEADAYIQFYRSMGLNPNRLSNPFRQAFRFTKKRYRSISPIIDLAMYAEYGTGVSFQVMSSSAIDGSLRLEPASGSNTSCTTAPPQLGEMGIFAGGKMVHSPSTGLLPEAMWRSGEPKAILRLMSPPGLGSNRLKVARQRFTSAPFDIRVNVLSEWEFSND